MHVSIWYTFYTDEIHLAMNIKQFFLVAIFQQCNRGFTNSVGFFYVVNGDNANAKQRTFSPNILNSSAEK